MQENILLDHESPMQRIVAPSAAENGFPHAVVAKLLHVLFERELHAHALMNCLVWLVVARSTMTSPSSLIQSCSQGSGFGAGPATFIPSLLNLLPWQGQAMMSKSC